MQAAQQSQSEFAASVGFIEAQGLHHNQDMTIIDGAGQTELCLQSGAWHESAPNLQALDISCSIWCFGIS